MADQTAPFSHTLSKPVTLTFKGPKGERTETISTIEMPMDVEILAKDLRATDGHEGEVGKTIALIAHFSGQPIRVIDELREADFRALNDHLAGFRAG